VSGGVTGDGWAGRLGLTLLGLGCAASTPSAEISRLQIRLPDGQRVIRAFYKTDKVETLYAFVESKVQGQTSPLVGTARVR
jgi:hypothetical protein